MSSRLVSRNHRVRTEQVCVQEEVARLAYQLYEEHGREDGHDLEDWLRAEAIVKERQESESDRA